MGAGLYPSASLRKEKANQGVSTAGAGGLILASRSVDSPRAMSARFIGPHNERLVFSARSSSLARKALLLDGGTVASDTHEGNRSPYSPMILTSTRFRRRPSNSP